MTGRTRPKPPPPTSAQQRALDDTLAYAARGWGTIALHSPIVTGAKPTCSCEKTLTCGHVGKHPHYHFTDLARGAHSATTNPATVRAWLRRWPDANIGIAVGPKWGLLGLDKDPRNGGSQTLADLEARLGKLPHTLTCLTGGGGEHRYFLRPEGTLAGSLGAGLDVKQADGELLVAPPSVHPSGNLYVWELSSGPGDVEVAALPEAWVRILRARLVGGDRESRDCRDGRDSGPPNPTPEGPVLPDLPDIPEVTAIPIRVEPGWTAERLIEETLPKGGGQHDLRTMDFARGVRLNLGILNPDDATPLFERWYERCLPFITEKDIDIAWMKFRRAHKLARIPYGVGGLAELALAAARQKSPPRVADRFHTERIRLLVSMCRELQLLAGGPFKLSSHQVADLFKVRAPQAWEWMQGLQDAGILRCRDRGRAGYGGSGAATYEYLGDMGGGR